MAFVIWLIWTSESFEKCQVERQNHESYAPTQEKIGFPVNSIVRLRLHLTCARVTLGDNDGAIVALATIVLAMFTWALWRSTEKLWLADQDGREDTRESIKQATRAAEAAERAARAAIGIELPRFIMDSVFMLVMDDKGVTLSEMWPSIRLMNHGRTSAEMLFESCDIWVGELLPKVPQFPNIVRLSVGKMIGPTKIHVINHDSHRPLTDSEFQAISVKHKTFWVFGLIGYRDFLGQIRVKRYSCRAAIFAPDGISVAGKPYFAIRFMPDGPAAYNSEHYQDEGRWRA